MLDTLLLRLVRWAAASADAGRTALGTDETTGAEGYEPDWTGTSTRKPKSGGEGATTWVSASSTISTTGSAAAATAAASAWPGAEADVGEPGGVGMRKVCAADEVKGAMWQSVPVTSERMAAASKAEEDIVGAGAGADFAKTCREADGNASSGRRKRTDESRNDRKLEKRAKIEERILAVGEYVTEDHAEEEREKGGINRREM